MLVVKGLAAAAVMIMKMAVMGATMTHHQLLLTTSKTGSPNVPLKQRSGGLQPLISNSTMIVVVVLFYW